MPTLPLPIPGLFFLIFAFVCFTAVGAQKMTFNSAPMKRFVLPAALLITLCLFLFFSPHFQETRSHLLRKPYSSKDRVDHSQQSSHPSQSLQNHPERPKRPQQYSQHNGIKLDRETLVTIREWQEREGLKKIVGFVFYGRRDQASILDCYLKVRRSRM